MDVLKKIELKAKKASELVFLSTAYLPGITEDLDQYRAYNDELGVSSYGDTEEEAISSARIQAFAVIMGEHSLAEKIITNYSKHLR